MSVSSGDHWREIFGFCDINTLISLSRTSKTLRTSLGLHPSPRKSSSAEDAGGQSPDRDRCYLNRRILSALLSPYPTGIDSVPAALSAVLHPALPADLALDAQSLVFTIFKTQRRIILDIHAKLVTFYEDPNELTLPLWSIGQDLRKHYHLINIQRKVDAGNDAKAYQLNPEYIHYPNYNTAILKHLPCSPKPLIPLDAIFFARYFQPFVHDALAYADAYDINVPSSEVNYANDQSFTASKADAPSGGEINGDWYGGWWHSPSGKFRLLIGLGSIGIDDFAGNLYLDCTPGPTSTSPSSSSTYGAVYHHTQGAPCTPFIHLLSHSLTDFLYGMLTALQPNPSGHGGSSSGEEYWKEYNCEFPEDMRNVPWKHLAKGRSVWVERAELIETVGKVHVRW
ncbi:hypothetical protein HK097_000265 [Rhizophlyctis rosea]|uniref:Uncharacterized protein n=1 Tax=Rhizophlyctis rosea TaxID=64517 RepID=A0AAD5S5T6_9FUNG|nr:hypothetical protein HK097_000265 [Rhizophlyctis rosea]